MPKELTIIDNLGGGHCGYISFIIGAFHLSQIGEAPSFLERWKELDPDVSSSLDTLIQKKIELAELAYDQNKILPLSDSIRKILCTHYLQSLPCEEDTRNIKYYRQRHQQMVFNEFSHLCRQAIYNKFHIQDTTGEFANMEFNLLWSSSKMRSIAQKMSNIAQENSIDINDEKQLNIFFHAALVINRDLVSAAYINWSKRNDWLTAAQAFDLAEIFNIPVVISTDCYRPEKGFVHLVNEQNVHWKVALYDKEHQYPFLERNLEVTSNSEHPNFSQRMQEIFSNKDHQSSMIQKVHDFQKYLSTYQQKFLDLQQLMQSNPQEFRSTIEKERFFALFKNCIDSKDDEIEFNIETKRLMIYLDPENSSQYQEHLEELQNQQLTMDKDEKERFDEYVKMIESSLNSADANKCDEKRSSSSFFEDLSKEDDNNLSDSILIVGAGLSMLAAIALVASFGHLALIGILCIVFIFSLCVMLGTLLDMMIHFSQASYPPSFTM